MIEARIVEADDNFGRALGVKLGCARPQRPTPGSGVGGGNSVSLPPATTSASVNRPARPPPVAATSPTRSSSTCRPTPAQWAVPPPPYLRAVAVQRIGQPFPEPGAVGAGSRRQGQDHLQPARHHRRPGQGADRAGRGVAVPGGHFQRRHIDPVPQGQPEARSHAADHARRQRDPRRGRQQGQRRPQRPLAGFAHQHQARQDAGAGRKRRHGGHRRHLHADRARRRQQGAAAGRYPRTSATCSRTRCVRPTRPSCWCS